MFNWMKKKPKTVLELVKEGKTLSDEGGLLELEVLDGKKVEQVSTESLDSAILEYFSGEWHSINKIENFFKQHRALATESQFEHWLYDVEEMVRPLLGLSILLMRDTFEPEAVKFGIYLSKFYDLQEAYGARKIMEVLGRDPHFTYYVSHAFLNLGDGGGTFYEFGQTLDGRAEEIHRKIAQNWVLDKQRPAK